MRSENNKEITTYGQTPSKLIKDKKLLGEEKNFYSYCHDLPGDKDFRENPNPVRKVNRKKAMKDLGFRSERTITNWTNRLENRGWISIEYGSKGYIIILHSNRKRRKKCKKRT